MPGTYSPHPAKPHRVSPHRAVRLRTYLSHFQSAQCHVTWELATRLVMPGIAPTPHSPHRVSPHRAVRLRIFLERLVGAEG